MSLILKSLIRKMHKKGMIKSGLALFTMIFLLLNNVSHARPNTNSCPAGNTIYKTFPSGAAWDMCWEVRSEEGIVLSDVHFKANGNVRRRILGEAGLSQIQTEYDDGSTSEYLVTQYGLGGANLQTLTSAMCEGGQLHNDSGRSVLCSVTSPNGYVYRHKENNTRQGDKFELFSASNVNGREFVLKWTFLENGTIEVGSGLTGQFKKTTSDPANGSIVKASNVNATSFTDHYFWRLDFDIATTNANDAVEQIRSLPSGDRLTKTKQIFSITNELASTFKPSEKRFWRIKDQSVTSGPNQNISYEMVMLNYAQQSYGNSNSPWLQNDVYFTKYNACERFAVKNRGNCGTDVSQYVSNESIHFQDVVAWYRLAHHTMPSDDDFSIASVRWSKFVLLPRDWISTNSL